MGRWTLEDIPWDRFDKARVDLDMLRVVKAASLVEHNARDYALYLRNVFADDPDFQAVTEQWSMEEVQHGQALGRWAELADPTFIFADCFQRFIEGYRIPVESTASVRGSSAAELISRCVVESGTSSFYSSLRDATDEPVLRAICQRIAGDEFRHYKMSFAALDRYLRRQPLSRSRRLQVAFSRYREISDDELAYAFHCANMGGEPYDRRRAAEAYYRLAFQYYRKDHMRRAVGMMARAAGFDPRSKLIRVAGWLAWHYTHWNSVRRAVA
jgi:rubrerythrin